MKLNMGCGFNKTKDFINVDKAPECQPDLLMDLESLPWNIESNQADEVLFNHCLEHLGQDTKIFLGIMKELYRICKPNAKVLINVPHPRHDFFIGDPTHVRVINPLVLSLFSKKNNLMWQEQGASNSPLAVYLGVNFEMETATQVLEKTYLNKLEKKQMTVKQVEQMIQEKNNVVQEYRFVLRVIK